MALRIPVSSIRHRKEFNVANKNADETLDNWYNRLKELAVPCQYGSDSEAFILHQFICGLDVLFLDRLLDGGQQKELSLIDIFDLTKNIERINEPIDVKPVLLSIKQEEQLSSDGEQYNDHTFNDGDSDYENDGSKVSANEEKHEDNEDAKKDNIISMAPFMAQTVIDPQTDSNMFECYLCHKTWKTAGNLTYHFTCYHTIGKTSKCHLCGKWIKDASNMVRHLNTHFSTKLFRCHICDFPFARAMSLKKHLLIHSDPHKTTYKCSKCPQEFISKKHLKMHKRMHNAPTLSLSEKLDEIVKQQKLQKAKAKAQKATEGSFKCEICAKAFEADGALNEHMKVHCETEWLCHLCGKKLMNKRNLIHHYRVHTNEKPFTCSDCNRAFSSKEKLKLHSKSHSDTRPHSCTHCKKSFIQKGHLVKHMKVHFPDAKIKCSLCTKSFNTEATLSKHALTHLGIAKPYDCRFCQKPFKSNSHLMEHERTHTGEKPYNCTLCSKSFAQRSTLRGHLRWHEKPKVERTKKKRKPKIDTSIGYPIMQSTSAFLH